MRILFTMVQRLYTKFKQYHFPLKCFKNYSIHENNSYYTMPFTSPPSKKGKKVLKEPPPRNFYVVAETLKNIKKNYHKVKGPK